MSNNNRNKDNNNLLSLFANGILSKLGSKTEKEGDIPEIRIDV
jgi:hypothetical protein